MPRAVLYHSPNEPPQVRWFATPKRITELYKGWYKSARKVLPALPELVDPDSPFRKPKDYYVMDCPEVSTTMITMRIGNDLGARLVLKILRQGGPFDNN
jgi:hypothetical protein